MAVPPSGNFIFTLNSEHSSLFFCARRLHFFYLCGLDAPGWRQYNTAGFKKADRKERENS